MLIRSSCSPSLTVFCIKNLRICRTIKCICPIILVCIWTFITHPLDGVPFYLIVITLRNIICNCLILFINCRYIDNCRNLKVYFKILELYILAINRNVVIFPWNIKRESLPSTVTLSIPSMRIPIFLSSYCSLAPVVFEIYNFLSSALSG